MIYDLVIAGGGVAGLTLALLASQNPELKILVIEQNLTVKAVVDYDLRCSALNRQSLALFAKLGILPDILAAGKYGVFEQIAVYTESAKVDFMADEIASDYLGYILQNQALVNALLARLALCAQVTLLNAKIVGVEANACCVSLNTGKSLYYKLLVASDGRYSVVRQLLGIDVNFYDYHDSALVASVRTSLPAARVASQFFCQDSVLAFLPLAEDTEFSIVLSQNAALNADLSAKSKVELGYILSEKSNYTFGQIELASEVASFPVAAQHARNYLAHDNIVLVGDSAHCIHPLAGQGLNLGLADVAYLGHLIQQQTISYRDLRQYECKVKLNTSLVLNTMTGIRKFFGWQHSSSCALRALQRLPAAKAALMRAAVYGLSLN